MQHLNFISPSLYTASVVVCAAMVLSGAAALRAGEIRSAPGPDSQQYRVARKLIEGLNSDHFLVREKAKDGLYKMGRAAIDPLEVAAKSSESEVRLRAVELLIALRGRGLLGIQMMQEPLARPPEWGAGAMVVQKDMPADVAGLQAGDIIVALNGEPVPDSTELQHLVFITGPARVMDVVAERGGEKIHFPVLLTLNLNYPANPADPPPIDLESELPASDNPQGRIAARTRMQQNFAAGGGNIIIQGGGNLVVQGGAVVIRNGNVVQIQGNGQAITSDMPVAVRPAPTVNVDVNAIESDFEKLKAEVEKDVDVSHDEKMAK